MKPHPSPEQRAACIVLYQIGAPMKLIAEAVGCAPQSLQRWIRDTEAKRGHKFRSGLTADSSRGQIAPRPSPERNIEL